MPCLMLSVALADERMFDLLIRLGADPFVMAGRQDHSILHTATSLGEHGKDALLFTRKCLSLGLSPDISGPSPYSTPSPLHRAVSSGSIELVGILLDAGANLEQRRDSHQGDTPLISSVRDYNVLLTRFLLDRGANVNAQESTGATPLILACFTGLVANAKAIVEIGHADLTIRNEAGSTALDEADRRDMWECALYVWSVGCESGTFKTTRELGPVKWTRPRILGYPSMDTADDTYHLDLKLDQEDAETEDGDDEEGDGNVEGGNENGDEGLTVPSAAPPVDVSAELLPKPKETVPKAAVPPLPRHTPLSAVIGSSVYLLGGTGIHGTQMTSFQPDRSDYFRASVVHHDFYRLDLSQMDYVSLLPSIARKVPASSFSLDLVNKSPTMVVDDLTVTSMVPEDAEEDPNVASILAATPFRAEDVFSYFEVEVVNLGQLGFAAVGLVEDEESFDHEEAPGWFTESIGYHGDDASLFRSTNRGRQWGKRFATGDIIGCGILWETGEVFFSLNGEFLGVAYHVYGIDHYYACVSFRGADAQLKLNFGTVPFVFDFRAPSLQWERLPYPAGVMINSSLRLFSFGAGARPEDAALVLLGYPESLELMSFWVWHQEQWFQYKAEGDRPFLHCQGFTTVGDSIFAIGLNIRQPTQLCLCRLDITRKPTSGVVSGADDASAWQATWQRVSPNPSLDLPLEHSNNLSHSWNVIEKDFSKAAIAGVEGQLCFVGKTALALLNLETFEIEVKTYTGAVPHVKTFEIVVIGHHIEVFGGWDDHGHRNDVNILDTRRAVWYTPHTLGAPPRPREDSTGVLVKVPTSKHMRQIGKSDLHSDSLLPEREYSSTYILHGYGWNGVNYIDDVEILSLQHSEEANGLIQLLKPTERQGNAGIINFKVISTDGVVNWFSTDAIVIAARASKLRQQIIDSRDKALTIEVSDVSLRLFTCFIKFLHDDLTEFGLDNDDARLFYQVFEQYAPEHSRRVAEALVLSHLNVRSRMAEDMAWALKSDLHLDLCFNILDEASNPRTIKVHRSILTARSRYFHSLLTGGLAESSTDTITIEDSDYKSFRIMLNYLYTAVLDLEDVADVITEVFILACKYGISDLRLQVESIIAYNLSPENAISLLLLADAHQSEGLRQICAHFIAGHYDEVQASEDYAPNAELVRSLVQLP